MPRTRRRWEPHAIHHAVARAHCGSSVFAAESDRAFVVRRAARAFDETGAICLGWAVLSNHYHVLLRCPGPPGPTFARLNTALAKHVSKLRGDRGAVFQNRYYSDPCEEEGALLRRLVYVLGNPVHHRIVPTVSALREYPWSGLGEVLGMRPSRWTDVSATLELIHPDPERARRALLDALEAKAAEWASDGADPDEDRGLRDEPGAGPSEGPIAPPTTTTTGTSPRTPSPATPIEPPDCVRRGLVRIGWTPDRLLAVACDLTGADRDLVAAGARSRAESAARGVVAHVACSVAGLSMTEVAPCVGVGPSTLVRAMRRGRTLLAELKLQGTTVLDRSRGSG